LTTASAPDAIDTSWLEPCWSETVTYKTVSLTLIVDGENDGDAAIGWAIDLAARHNAHLAVGLGVPPLIIPVDAMSAGVMATYEEENVTLRQQSESFADRVRNDAMRAGVSAGVEINSQAYRPLSSALVRLARLSDICVVAMPDRASAYKSDTVIDILMSSGAPVAIIPKDWQERGPVTTAVLGWDESTSAARAVREALPLLGEAQKVEVVCVTGDKAMRSAAPGADLAQYLARHIQTVTETEIPLQASDVGAMLLQQASLSRANLLVMGAYGHTRFREFVLGGVTRSMLQEIKIPTLMAH
jgi:nucleotide-binding universal stress UspA family protein